MKIIAINGSPRKKENTATMCNKFLEGAKSACSDVETEIINLFDLNYKGCISCFGCKRKEGNTYGKCIVKDELQPILEKVSTADGVVFGSPIYFGDITGQLRSFFERLLFPFSTYEEGYKKIAPKKMPTAMIYAMNVTEDLMKKFGYDVRLSNMELIIASIFRKPEIIYAFNTYQFSDYNKYKMEIFSEKVKAEHKRTQFPIDCQNAFDAGKRMVMQVQK